MTSCTTNDISGWTPLDGDDEDIIVSQDMYSMTTINILPSSVGSGTFLSSTCPPLDTIPMSDKPHPSISIVTSRSDSISMGPLTCLPRISMAPSSDRRAQRNRSRDPGWIPRPRNAFIIFRCEYSREHLQSSQDSEEPNHTTNPTAKTLSKRAADAWKRLSPSERDRYKLLAEKEREEHARTYPHYRFRPMRRQPSGNKKMFQVAHQDVHSQVSTEHFPVAPTRLPSVLAPSPADPHVKAQSEEPTSQPPSPRDTQPEPSLTMFHRRSSSAPNAELLSLPHIVPSHRDRRSNSVIEKALKLATTPPPWQVAVPPSFEYSSYNVNSDADPAGPPTLNYDYSIPFLSSPSSEVTFRPVFSPDENKSIHMPSPLTSATSSLIGWNGDFGPLSPVTPVPNSTLPAEVTLSVSSSPRLPVDESCSPLWAPPVGIPADAFLSNTASYDPDPSYGDPERIQALEAYAIGLYNYDLFTGPSPLFPEESLDAPCGDETAAIFPGLSLGL